MKFKASVIPAGDGTCVEIPNDVVETVRSGARPLITIAINGHAWCSSKRPGSSSRRSAPGPAREESWSHQSATNRVGGLSTHG